MIPQLFIISTPLYKSFDRSAVLSSFKDMEDLGIAKYPFPKLSIRVQCNLVLVCENGQGWPDDQTITLHYENGEFQTASLEENRRLLPVHDIVGKLHSFNTPGETRAANDISELAKTILKALIVALATKNVEKTITKNSLAKFGVGKNKSPYTTTLSIGKVTENEQSTGSGRTIRPHLRRGHIRRQHYGPGHEFVKSIWIEPVIVNCDLPEEPLIRQAYNVRKD